MKKLTPLIAMLALIACSAEQAEVTTAAEETPTSVEEDTSTPDDLEIFTVNYPLAYFAGRIVGDRGNVTFPAPPDTDPAMWSPDADTIIEYQQADVILLNGAGYARWVANATLPESRLVDTTAALADRFIPIENVVTHSHGPGGEHSHAGTAFTTWLDLDLAIGQARAVADALIGIRPDEEAAFRQAFAALEADLRDLDSQLTAAAGRLGDRPVLFSHPVYQYLQARYNLNGHSVHWEPGELPDEALWRELGRVVEKHPAAVMIWEGAPLPETENRLTEMGIASVIFAPGGNRPAEGDLLDLMREGIASLEAAASY